MEETIGKRINLERSEEIVDLQVSNLAVGCPFCLTIIEDSIKALEKEGKEVPCQIGIKYAVFH